MSILLTWSNPSQNQPLEDEVNLYRDTNPIDTGSLPPPLVVLPSGTTRYLDDTAVNGVLYHYLVGYSKGDQEVFSNPLSAKGPAELPVTRGETAIALGVPWYFSMDDEGIPVLSADSEVIRGDLHSTRKLLACLVAWEEKKDVWETELIEIEASDIASTSGEWLSGLEPGDLVTWKDLVTLQLVPSKSDVSATTTRVLGQHLLDKYEIGGDVHGAIGYWMTQAAIRAGAFRTLAFTNNPGSAPGAIVRTPVIGPARDMGSWLSIALTVPELQGILLQQSCSISVQGPNPRVITWPSMDFITRGADIGGTSQGPAPGNYRGGKTGDFGKTGHQIASWVSGSGKNAFAVVGNVSSRSLRAIKIRSLIAQTEALAAQLQSGGSVDPHNSQVGLRVLGSLPLTDLSPSGVSITSTGGVAEDTTRFPYSSQLTLSNAMIRVDEKPILGSGDFTIELMGFLPPASGVQEFIGVWRTSSGQRSWAIQRNSNTFHFWYSANGTTNTSVNASYSGQSGEPFHLVAQREGNFLGLYYNGQLLSSVELPSGFSFHNPAETPLGIGSRLNSGGTAPENYANMGFLEASVTVGVARYPRAGFLSRIYPNRF